MARTCVHPTTEYLLFPGLHNNTHTGEEGREKDSIVAMIHLKLSFMLHAAHLSTFPESRIAQMFCEESSARSFTKL